MTRIAASIIARVRGAPILGLALCALVLAGTGLALAGHSGIPRARLEVANRSTSNGYVAGSWEDPALLGCGVIVVDPPPGAPRALKVPAGRHRMTVVLREHTKPRRVRVSVVRPGGRENGRRVRIFPRRNDAGRVVAWEARFRAKLRKRLDIYATGVWGIKEDCGGGRLTWWFRLRAAERLSGVSAATAGGSGHNRHMSTARLAMDPIPLIKRRLSEIDDGEHDPVASGRRAALWRAQAQAARVDRTLPDLRRYCLSMLRSRRALDEEPPDYLRGYREGFQLVLRDLRRLE